MSVLVYFGKTNGTHSFVHNGCAMSLETDAPSAPLGMKNEHGDPAGEGNYPGLREAMESLMDADMDDAYATVTAADQEYVAYATVYTVLYKDGTMDRDVAWPYILRLMDEHGYLLACNRDGRGSRLMMTI